MANIYVRSTDGSDADNGSTWALAKATLTGAAAIDANGDSIYVSQSHAESTAGAITLAFAGTAASPVKVICGNDAAEPPTAVANTATVSTTGANNIVINGSAIFYGITFSAGSSTNNAYIQTATTNDTYQVYYDCAFIVNNSGGASGVILGSATASIFNGLKLINCIFKFGAASRAISGRKSKTLIRGGGIAVGSSAITTFIIAGSESFDFKVMDFDFTNAASGLNLIYSGVSQTGRIDFINCKLPASWSGGLVAGAPTNADFRASMYNCDSGATNYKLWIETYAGSIKSETTIVKTGGATDGTTSLSWKLVTTANANEYVAPLITDDMAVWIDTTGASKTITVDILHDSVTALTDAEVWLEIDYLGSSATPLGTPSSDKRATVLTTETAQATSTANWQTTGLTNPNKQKLEVTFTPQMKGFVYARVCLAKPSYTVYVDPQALIS
jgi:hypothetical protein